uniref:Uncharacterized protein n=1 Tax=Candidatus Kentrum sp. TUN TaxID=2126343 RepID=A0A451A879_9GAMM|nr:MAG: hypothetical protein BECKTUN1418D_GA0071000_11703 [Candidatus Kentron sp. TUN]
MNRLYLFGKQKKPPGRLRSAIGAVGRFLWRYSGAMHIREMARLRESNQPNYLKPPTLLLWIIGIYVALYGIASNRYEAALDRVENRMGALASQLSTNDDAAFKNLIEQIPHIQRRKTPLEPSLRWPFEGNSVFFSLWSEDENPEILE